MTSNTTTCMWCGEKFKDKRAKPAKTMRAPTQPKIKQVTNHQGKTTTTYTYPAKYIPYPANYIPEWSITGSRYIGGTAATREKYTKTVKGKESSVRLHNDCFIEMLLLLKEVANTHKKEVSRAAAKKIWEKL